MHAGKKPNEDAEASNCNVTLSPAQVERLLSLCSGLISPCSEVTGRIDPTVGLLLEYVGDEMRENNRSIQ